MRRLAGWLALGVTLAAGSVAAQPFHAQVPEGEGTIRGRLAWEGAAGAAAGLEVILYARPGTGAPGLEHSVSDSEGRFVFEKLSTDPSTVYWVGVSVDGIPFASRAAFAEGQREIEVEVEITEPEADSSLVEHGDAFLRIDRGCSGLRVHELHELHNPTGRVVFVPEEQRDRRPPIFRAELPARAGELTTPPGSGIQDLEQTGQELRVWGPLQPGSHQLEFGYALPGAPDLLRVERSFPAGARRVVLLSHERGPELGGARLRPAQGRRIEGRAYRALEARDLRPGERLAFSVEIPPGPETPISLLRSQLRLELDDAALAAEEDHQLQVEGDAPLTADSDAPLLCLPLPAQATGLRFSSATLAMGLEREASGALVLRGPIPAGESTLSLRYRVPVAGDQVSLVRSFPRTLPLLSILIADTGVEARTERLHPRRPLFRNGRSYLHLEGFEIEPEERVEIALARLPAPRPLPRPALAGLALLAMIGAILFLSAPLRRRPEPPEAEESPASRLASEREALYGAIRDLDEDFETGKLSAEDHAALRNELRAQAARLLQAERESARQAPPPAAGAEARCRDCGAQPPPDANFCPRCGARLAATEGSP